MRTRLAVLLALVLVVPLLAVPAIPAHAAGTVVLAQQPSPAEEPGTTEGDGEGQSEPEAETGADEGQAEDAAEETGPLWTYQMARIVIVLLVLMVIAIAGAYYRFVHKRATEGI